MGKEQISGFQGESPWIPMIREAERQLEEVHAIDPYSKKYSMCPDWSEEVLSRVRGELPAPSSASSASTTGETPAS